MTKVNKKPSRRWDTGPKISCYLHFYKVRLLWLLYSTKLARYAYKGVDFDVQNVLQLTYEHLYFPNFFQGGWYPRTPLKEGGEELREGDGMERQGK